MSRSTMFSGDVSIVMDDSIEFLTDELLDKIAPATRDAMKDTNKKVVAKVKRQWPIGRKRAGRSFHSVERFASTVTIQGQQVGGVVVNTAFWARMIRRKNAGPVFDLTRQNAKVSTEDAKKLARSKLVWKSLLAKVGEEEAPELLDKVMKDLARF